MGGSAGARWKTGDRLQGGWVIVVRDNPKIEVPKICWRRLQLSAALPALGLRGRAIPTQRGRKSGWWDLARRSFSPTANPWGATARQPW